MIENWWPTQIGYYDNPNHVDISSHCLDIKSKVESGSSSKVSIGSLRSANLNPPLKWLV